MTNSREIQRKYYEQLFSSGVIQFFLNSNRKKFFLNVYLTSKENTGQTIKFDLFKVVFEHVKKDD